MNSIEEKAQAAADKIADSKKRFPGMTYEQGVIAALEWVANGCPDDESDPSNEF